MRITLTFVLAEDVTPDYLAYRVAAACHTEYDAPPRRGGGAAERSVDPTHV